MNNSKWLMGVSVLALTLAFSLPAAMAATKSTQAASGVAAEAGAADDVPTLIVTNKPMSAVLPGGGGRGVSTDDLDNGTLDALDVKGAKPLSPPVPGLASTSSTGVYKGMMTEAPSIGADAVLSKDYFAPANTMAAQKIDQLREEMFTLQSRVSELSERLSGIQQVGQELSANYYASVATINTQLQSGTTPGNPRLMERLTAAQDALETLSGNVSDMNAMALQISDAASMASYLQEATRAAYGLTGSVEEDHSRLAQLEDSIANTSTLIERLLNNVNDDITRNAAYLNTERSNLRTLALAVANGDLYGRSLANRPFLSVEQSRVAADMAAANPGLGGAQPASLTSGGIKGALSSPRPLVVVRFDKPDVNYQQAVYQSVSDALEKYPNARFELVAVAPGSGNPARKAIEATRSRRNAEKVLRTLTEMGLAADRIDLSAMTNENSQTNEVQLYIR